MKRTITAVAAAAALALTVAGCGDSASPKDEWIARMKSVGAQPSGGGWDESWQRSTLICGLSDKDAVNLMRIVFAKHDNATQMAEVYVNATREYRCED